MTPSSTRSRGGADPAARIQALDEALRLAHGRLGADVEARAAAVLARARERLALSGEYTVVALAGATGSGKSSLLNALVGAKVARPGVTRPTTGRPLAVVLPAPDATGTGVDGGPHELLDWLDVADRHVVAADGTLDVDPDAPRSRWWRRGGAPSTAGPVAGPGVRPTGVPDGLPTGAVLLDLPDHDSVVAEHRNIAERLYARADLLVWVVDPQKYADAALHVRYLRPLAGHTSVLVLALNQADRLAPGDVAAVVADLRRLTARDGLGDVPVLPVSAATGDGVDALRGLLADVARRRRAATERVLADVGSAAAELRDACGTPARGDVPQRTVDRLVDALEVAAGVPLVVDATRRSTLRQARAVTGWPVTRWVGRLRADPLGRLGLGRPPSTVAGAVARATRDRRDARSGSAAQDAEAVAASRRSSVPVPATTTGALVSLAVRDYLDAATAGSPDAWTLAARAAVERDALPDALDRAVVASAPAGGRDPAWWRAVGVVQWVLLAVAVAGAAWLAALAVLAYLRLPEPVTPTWGEVPWPTVLTLGGIVLGVLLALVSRVLAGVGARRRARRVRRRLRDGVHDVADRLVVAPVTTELGTWAACRDAAVRAAG